MSHAKDSPLAVQREHPHFPAVNPHASTDLHRVWAYKMDDGELEYYSFTILIIISILFDPFFSCMLLTEKCCHSLFIHLFTETYRGLSLSNDVSYFQTIL